MKEGDSFMTKTKKGDTQQYCLPIMYESTSITQQAKIISFESFIIQLEKEKELKDKEMLLNAIKKLKW